MTTVINSYSELSSLELGDKCAFVMGAPASGKTTLADHLLKVNSKHIPIRTDNYMNLGFERSMYLALEDYNHGREMGFRVLCEGVQCYRILRKLDEMGGVFPEVIVLLKISEQQLISTYTSERDALKLKGVMAMFKSMQDLEYQISEIINPNRTRLITYLNNY